MKKWKQEMVVGISWLCSGVLSSLTRALSLHRAGIWSLLKIAAFTIGQETATWVFRTFISETSWGLYWKSSAASEVKKYDTTTTPPWHKFDLSKGISVRVYFSLDSADFFTGQMLTYALTFGGSSLVGFCLSSQRPRARHHDANLLVPYFSSSSI